MAMNGSVSDGDCDGILGGREYYFPPNFKEYLLKEALNWWLCEVASSCGWVFWSQQDHEIEPALSLKNCADFNPNASAILKVRDNIRHALRKMILLSSKFMGCLVQFWAPTKTLEGRALLTTQFQPFAIAPASFTERQRLCEYRMICREYSFFADAESGEEQQLGLPGRVFLHKFPESTPSVKYYSKTEYPQRDDALRCKIDGCWALPVFENSSQACVGVLEIVSLHRKPSVWLDKSFLRRMYDSFQEFGLICFDGYKHCEMQCRDDNIKARTTAFQELNMVLRSVCEIHELPLAMTWVPCSACNDLLRGQLLSEGVEFCDHRNIHLTDFLQVSKCSHLRKGGIFEKALSSPYMLYCADITQISLTDYPLVPYARMCNFSGWFTLCLQSSYTETEVYVLEFFLPTSSMDNESILTTLSLILGTMEANFKTFKLASGQQLGEVLSAEVMDFRNGQKLHFVQMIQAPRLSPSPELLKDRGLMLQLTSLEEGKRKKQRKHKGSGVRIEVSLDDILKCAKMKRKGAAEKLKVSTSTFKRACREYGIDRWSPRNIENVNPFRHSPVENQGLTPQLNSDLPSNQAVPGVALIKPRFQDANMVTVRAKYNNKTIKFQLSFSSTLVEFQQEVAKRLKLEAETYYVEYKDEEDELILIACDEDLQSCMHTSRSQGNTSIVVLLELKEPVTNLNPAN